MTRASTKQAGRSVPDCGTDKTPPCPTPGFWPTLTLVVDRLAGEHATEEHRRGIAAMVDTHLHSALRVAMVLFEGASRHVPAAPPAEDAADGPRLVFLSTRKLVIERLAGKHTTRERRRSVAAMVDTYLQGALGAAMVLFEATLRRAPDATFADDSTLLRRRSSGPVAAHRVKRTKRARPGLPRGRW